MEAMARSRSAQLQSPNMNIVSSPNMMRMALQHMHNMLKAFDPPIAFPEPLTDMVRCPDQHLEQGTDVCTWLGYTSVTDARSSGDHTGPGDESRNGAGGTGVGSKVSNRNDAYVRKARTMKCLDGDRGQTN